jgi:hypothetical protein
MQTFHLTVMTIGIGLAAGILYLIRRDHLQIRQGLFWILVATLSFLFGVWPYLIDALGELLDVAYPPTLIMLAAIIVLVIKALVSDIALTRLSRDLRRLNQRIALLEAEMPGRDAGPRE